MRISSTLLAMAAFLFGFMAVALAQDAPATTVNLGGFLAQLLPLLTELAMLVIAALIGWATLWVKRKFGLDIEARHREALHWAIRTGINSALARYKGPVENIRVDVRSAMAAEAVNYVLRSVPDAVKFFGVTPERIRVMAAAKLAEQFGTAAAPAASAPAAEPGNV